MTTSRRQRQQQNYIERIECNEYTARLSRKYQRVSLNFGHASVVSGNNTITRVQRGFNLNFYTELANVLNKLIIS